MAVVNLSEAVNAHACQFYHGNEHLLQLTTPCLVSGLRQGKLVIACFRPDIVAELKSDIRRAGVIGGESLRFPTNRQYVSWYGDRSEQEMRSNILKMLEDAERMGRSGLLIAADGSYITELLPMETVMSIDAVITEAIAGLPVVILCLFPLESGLREGLQERLLACHTHTLVGGQLHTREDNGQEAG